MKEKNILFSIILPTFNRSYLIQKAIKSVLCQSYPVFELIIVDDGSKDNTGEVVKSFKDQRIKYYYLENQGRSFARKQGIKKSQGDYISFLDSDDFYKPD